MLINIGPQHPATHGVLRLVLELDGETVVRCIPHIGYLHCGFEKIGEYRQYNQIIPWTDREDYLNSPGNNVAFALGAERLFGIEITERCKVLRVIAMRAVAHHLAPRLARHDLHRHRRVHAVPLGVPGARERLQPARGLGRRAAHDERSRASAAWAPTFPTAGARAAHALPHDLPEDARRDRPHAHAERDLGGPHGRTRRDVAGGSGELRTVRSDGARLRRRATTCARTSRTSTTRRTTSTCRSARTATSTIATSCAWKSCASRTRILEQAVKRLPDGPVNVDDHRVILPPKSKATSDMESMIHHFKQVMEGPRPPIGEAYVAVESPKGEKGYYMVSDGTAKPVRWRIRPPSFVNLSAIPKMVEGHLLSDVIAINASHRHRHGRDRPVSARARRRARRARDGRLEPTVTASRPRRTRRSSPGSARGRSSTSSSRAIRRRWRRCCPRSGWCSTSAAG